MKKRMFVSALLACLCTMPFYAQKFHAGLTTGLSVATLSEIGALYDNSALKTGFGGGLTLLYDIDNTWGVQSGLLYEQKGFRKKDVAGSEGEKITGTYNYITIPLLAQGSFALSGNTRMYGITGVYAGFKTYSENALVSASGETAEVPDGSEIRKSDFGWVIGGGIQVPAGKHLMQAGLKYSLGLTRVTDDSPDSRNKSLLIAVSLFF